MACGGGPCRDTTGPCRSVLGPPSGTRSSAKALRPIPSLPMDPPPELLSSWTPLAYSEKKLTIGETLTDVWRLKKVNNPSKKRRTKEQPPGYQDRGRSLRTRQTWAASPRTARRERRKLYGTQYRAAAAAES